MKSKKGQIATLGNAPYIVMVVGFTFLLMATIAYVSYEYQGGFSADESTQVSNETLSSNVTEAGVQVATSGACNFENFVVGLVTAQNQSSDWWEIGSANYTYDSEGYVYFSGDDTNFNNTVWNVNYTYDYTGTPCNITNALNVELDDNTSIAGVVLTIALVGIILSIMIGIFLGTRRSGI